MRARSAPGGHDRRVAGALAVFFVVLYGGFHHGSFKGTDEIGVFETTRSIYLLGRLSVPPGRHVFLGADGASYNHFAIGQSILALPFYGVGALSRAALPDDWAAVAAGPPGGAGPLRFGGTLEILTTSFYGVVASALLVVVFFWFERALGVSLRSSAVAALALGCTTYVAPMSAYFLRHTTEAILILGSLLALLSWSRSGRRGQLLLGCSLASAILLVRVPALIAGAGLALTLAFGLTRVHRTENLADCARAFLRDAPFILLPFFIAVAIHAGVNHAKWGTWFASPMVSQWQLFSTPLAEGLAGFLISPSTSVFLYSPPLLVACAVFPRLLRTRRVAALAALGISLSFLFFCAKFKIWSGLYSAPGPRYLFVATPLLMLGIGPWLDSAPGKTARLVWIGTLAVGAGIQLLLLVGNWGSAIQSLGYLEFEPQLGFLFDPAMSPLVGYANTVVEGQFSPWVLKLAVGWRGFAGAPSVAAGLAAAWLAILALSGLRLRRLLRPASSVSEG